VSGRDVTNEPVSQMEFAQYQEWVSSAIESLCSQVNVALAQVAESAATRAVVASVEATVKAMSAASVPSGVKVVRRDANGDIESIEEFRTPLACLTEGGGR
jgi:hypothetical protein